MSSSPSPNSSSQYLPYEINDYGDADQETQEKLIKSIFGEAEKKKEIIDKKQYCPLCKYESGETIRLVIRDDGLVYCPQCKYNPIESGLRPPTEGDHVVLSANSRQMDGSSFGSIKTSDLARIGYAKRRRYRGKLRNDDRLNALHETNLVNPKSLNSY